MLNHPEPHVSKAIRALYYGAQLYGYIPAGSVSSTFHEIGAETHKRTVEVDGTMFCTLPGVFARRLVGWFKLVGLPMGNLPLIGTEALGWEEAWA
ncbi:hypothetical protein B0H19DRAFT_1158519 [Mycena capillaripes]|nr:hypothetical protein B0H19DRAFT_1158519 [Mycena capillaripes]